MTRDKFQSAAQNVHPSKGAAAEAQVRGKCRQDLGNSVRMGEREYRVGYTLWPGNFELTDPGRFLDEAEDLGVDNVEIPFFTTRLIANGRIQEQAMRWFEGQTRGRRLGYSTHGMLTINLMDEPERLAVHETVAKANIELTARLGGRHMVLHCGLAADSAPDALAAAYGRQRESLARLGDFAREHDVIICVETIWSFDGRETALASELARELHAIGHPNVMATLDYAHIALQADLKGADLMSEIAAISPLSPHLHLNDCFGSEKALPIALPAEAMAYGSGDLHLPIGWGSLDWDRMLGEVDYPDQPLILNQELHPTYWYALADDVAEMRRLTGVMEKRRA